MKSLRLSSIVMQYLLIATGVIIIALIIAIFYFAQALMTEKAVATDHAKTDAELASQELINLQSLQKLLAESQPTIEKTRRIVAESQQYNFQDQVIRDVTEYAQQNGVGILGFDFGAKPGSVAATSSNPNTKSQQKTIVTVKLDNNLRYDAFLRFIRSIENNITKMQLTGIQIQPVPTDPSMILGPSIELEVFIR